MDQNTKTSVRGLESTPLRKLPTPSETIIQYFPLETAEFARLEKYGPEIVSGNLASHTKLPARFLQTVGTFLGLQQIEKNRRKASYFRKFVLF